MASIKDQLRVAAPTSKVFEALSRQTGYRGWWNAAAEVPESEGKQAQLRFIKDGTPVNMRFRIDELTPNQRVRWTCIAHDLPGWVNTTLDWNLDASGPETLVRFEHAGWKEGAPEPVRDGWKHFLGSLKAYVETGSGQPW